MKVKLYDGLVYEEKENGYCSVWLQADNLRTHHHNFTAWIEVNEVNGVVDFNWYSTETFYKAKRPGSK